jgi:hypothetical protein
VAGEPWAYLLDYAHRLVAEDVALVDERPEYLVEMQVRAADSRRRDAHDRVGRLLNRRVWHVVHPYVTLAVPCQCFHPTSYARVDPDAMRYEVVTRIRFS